MSTVKMLLEVTHHRKERVVGAPTKGKIEGQHEKRRDANRRGSLPEGRFDSEFKRKFDGGAESNSQQDERHIGERHLLNGVSSVRVGRSLSSRIVRFVFNLADGNTRSCKRRVIGYLRVRRRELLAAVAEPHLSNGSGRSPPRMPKRSV